MTTQVQAADPAAGLLAGAASVLAVVAHPDDESFGLGGVLERLAAGGAATAVLCFTHGEASTLHGLDRDLGTVRPAEFAAATRVLGIERAELLAYPDGALGRVPVADLAGHVTRLARQVRPTHLLAFDTGGITGHPDHTSATAAALAAAGLLGIPVLIWALPAAVADALNSEFGTSFAGRPPAELTELAVDRARQWDAIACHASQSGDNPVLRRRLELLGGSEHLLLAPAPAAPAR
ncbi:MAG: PIG-L deacetylase family protein [Gemmatimonadota bacterium]